MTDKKDVIRLGVIGMGPRNMASTFTLLKDVPDLRYQITSVCGLPAAQIEKCAADFGVPHWTTDYRELVSHKDVDVVCVFSPDHLHAEHSLAAIAAGKHVVCGKPNATTLEECRVLVAGVKQAGVKYLAAYTLRQDQQYLVAKKLLDDGDLGSLIALESFYLHDMRDTYDRTPWRVQAPQDMMFGGCMHAVDILRAFAGDVESVHANANQGGLTPAYPIPDNFFLNLKFTSGAIGRVSGLYGIVHPPMPMNQIGLYGSRASLVAEYGPSQFRVVFDKLPGQKPFVTTFNPEPESSRYWYGPNIIRYMRHFQDCLDNDREPSPGVVESAKSVAVGAAAWESIQTGRAIQVCNDF